jgi:DNA-binding GntR family transcriptional regulator
MLERMPSVSGHISEHAELLTAIADGDEDRAAELALHHVVSFEETIRKVL